MRRFQDLVRRRAVGREPVAYLLGRKGFRRLELEVDARVLVPRPETELLVEVAARSCRRARASSTSGPARGAVALALADERPDLRVTGTDVSPTRSMSPARTGAARPRRSTGSSATCSRRRRLVDAVVANLPYVEPASACAPEIARHEPALALFAGPDGLDAIRALVARAAHRRRAGSRSSRGDAGPAVRALLARRRLRAGARRARPRRPRAGDGRC